MEPATIVYPFWPSLVSYIVYLYRSILVDKSHINLVFYLTIPEAGSIILQPFNWQMMNRTIFNTLLST